MFSDWNIVFLFLFQSEQISHLVKIPGIVIAASSIRAKATKMTIQCRSCRNFINDIALKPGLEGYAMPRKCPTYVILSNTFCAAEKI